jgi:hypothetical protein
MLKWWEKPNVDSQLRKGNDYNVQLFPKGSENNFLTITNVLSICLLSTKLVGVQPLKRGDFQVSIDGL